MSDPSGRNLLEWREHRSAHFAFWFLSDPQIENIVTTLATRLEAVRDATVKTLDLADLPGGRIQVYLLSYVPGGRGPEGGRDDSQVYEAGGRPVIAVRLSDALGRVLERALVELLLTSSLGIRADRSAALIDGTLGYVTHQIDGSEPAGLRSDEARGSLVSVLRGPADVARTTSYQQIVTSFVAFLLTSYGAGPFKRFARGFDPGAADRASEAAYGKPMAELEREWLATPSRPAAPGSARGKPVATPEEEQLEVLRQAQQAQTAGPGSSPPPAAGGPPSAPGGSRPAQTPPGAAGQPPPSAPPGVMAFLRGALVYLRPYWKQEILILLATIIGAIFPIVLSLAFGGVITALGDADYRYLWTIVIGVVALYVIQIPATLGKEYLSSHVGAEVLNDIQYKMFAHLQRLSTDYYFRTRPGDITSRFTNDLALLNTALTQVLPMLATLLVTFVGSLISLFFLQGLLALAVVLALPLFLILPTRLGARAAQVTHEVQQDRATVASAIQETVGAQQIVKAYSLQRATLDMFREQLDRLGRSASRGGFLSSLPGTTANLSVILIQVLALAGGSIAVIYGALDVGAMASFQLLLGGVTGPMMSITGIWQMLLQSAVGMQRVDELLEEQPQIVDRPGAKALGRLQKEIRFENVDFSYTGEQMNLRDVNLRIGAGQSVAFVGPSGSGKSTILNLIIRFYDPTSGAVTIDGYDIRTVTQDSLRRQMGTVFQETFLYNASVRENIRQVKPDATDEEVEAAARAAEIHDFIMTMPQGYDTPVGERGATLSGGQRQRIAIARAILYDPAILVLDEPTSALDPQTEAAINATLREQGRGRTVLTVTHRLASVVDVDRIFVLERGRIVEQGAHEELVRARGLYYRLWGQQNGFEDARRIGVEASRLRAIPFFENLDEALLPALAERFAKVRRDEGQTIFEEGDPGDKMYFIDRGEVEVVAIGPTGEERRVALLRDGDYFGEIALLEDVPRTATVRTRAATSLLELDRKDFLDLLRTAPDLRTTFERGVEARRQANLSALRMAAPAGER